MALPTYRASTTASNTSGLSTAISSPSSTAIGDVLTVVYTGYSSGTYSPTPVLPSGWTLLKQDIQTGNGYTVHTYTARFVATAAGAKSFTFSSSMTASGSYGADLALVCCYNQDSTTPVDDSQVATVPNGTTATSPAATATVANDLILCVYVDNGNTGAIPSLPSGLTSAVSYQDSTNGTGIRVGYASLASSGTTPTYTSTFGETVNPSSGVFGTMFTVLIKAASSGGTTYPQSLSGNITPSGVLIKKTNLPLSGTLQPFGALIKRTGITLTGLVSATGSLVKQTSSFLSGSVGIVGNLVKQNSLTLSGLIVATGNLTKQTSLSLSGLVQVVGGFTKQASVALSAFVSPSGGLVKQTNLPLNGRVTITGGLAKQTETNISGTIQPTGIIGTSIVFIVQLVGSIFPTGALSKMAKKVLSGSIAIQGMIGKKTSIAITGTIALAGILATAMTLMQSESGTIIMTSALSALKVIIAGGMRLLALIGVGQ